jgi:hypothetical protein
VIVAFFGGITIVIAAITAALCTGRDAHEDPARRYVAGVSNGLFYLIGGACGATIVSLFAVLPSAFVAVLAGLALIGAITANIMGAINEADHREASVITFLATASGMSFLGLGSAFWGVVIGLVAYLVLHRVGGPAAASADAPLAVDETPCFRIERIELAGAGGEAFHWALAAIDRPDDPPTGRCLGTRAINQLMTRLQNRIVSRGYITTRVVATAQDLTRGVLTLTVIPGRIRDIRPADGTQLHGPPRRRPAGRQR